VTVSLTERLRFYESAFGRGQLSRDERNFSVRCPICDPKDPNKKKLVIRTVDDVTHCWVCGFSSRSLAPLLRRFAGPSLLSHYVERFCGAAGLGLDAADKPVLNTPQDMRLLLPDFIGSDPDAIATYRYIRSRGVTDSDVWRRRVCFSNTTPWSRRVVFVSHDASGAVNYLTGRGIDRKQSPRYVNCDADRVGVVFQEVSVDWKSPLVLCEGPFDLLKCGDNATCMLGSELSESSLLLDRIVTHGTPVILAMDADTYDKKRPRVIRKLQEYDIDVRITDMGAYPDPGSAPTSFMQECIAKAAPVDWFGMFSMRLNSLTGSR